MCIWEDQPVLVSVLCFQADESSFEFDDTGTTNLTRNTVYADTAVFCTQCICMADKESCQFNNNASAGEPRVSLTRTADALVSASADMNIILCEINLYKQSRASSSSVYKADSETCVTLEHRRTALPSYITTC